MKYTESLISFGPVLPVALVKSQNGQDEMRMRNESEKYKTDFARCQDAMGRGGMSRSGKKPETAGSR